MNTQLSFFIIGMPRSGTKLFRNLLNNHSEIFIPEIETLFIPKLIQRYGLEVLTRNEIKNLIQELRESLFFFYYLKDNNFDFKSLDSENITVLDFINHFFIELARQNGKEAKIKGDKSPNYIHDLDLLLEYYTNAKFIHIVRDPRDYALSVKNAWNKNKERAVFNWVKGINKIQKVIKTHPKQILEIRYEDLIENPDKTLRKCTDFLDLEFEEGMNFLKSSAENLGDARSTQVEKKNKQKYHSRMSINEKNKIENYTIEFLKLYRYPFSTKSIKNAPTKRNREKVLKIVDGINLIKFNFREHGLINGISKMIKANKYS